MTRRITALLAATIALLALAGSSASAAVPALGPVSATNIQGVSAVLVGTVDPEGLSTDYYFEYGPSPSFAGAQKTSMTPVGEGSTQQPARAAIAGLVPSTTYYYRLIASNSSGTTTGNTDSFTTTAGFGLLPGEEGFSAAVYAEGGEPATESGTHPYQMDFSVGFRSGDEFEGQPGTVFPDGDVRDLRIEMPTGLIVNPSVTPECSRILFHTPRLSPFELSRSGEDCPDGTQVGTVGVATSEGERTFGLFNLDPAPGTLAQVGFSPFGAPVIIDLRLNANDDGSYSLVLEADNIPQALDLSGLKLSLWGTPWGASHNGERGDCLNETEPTFAWAKCSVGEPKQQPPLAYLSLQSVCSGALSFSMRADSWQQASVAAGQAVNRFDGGQPAEMTCQFLQFEPEMVGHLDSTKATSPSGYVFRLNINHDRLTNPAFTNPAPPRTVVVKLPAGTTVNPSVGAGLGVCTPAQFAAETPLSAQGDGCPAAAKIGTLTVKTPIFEDDLAGDIYLAQPNDPDTAAPGAENPFDGLVAVYLLAKAPKRGVMVKLAGQLRLDPGTGTVTGVFDGLPQLPYTDLEASFRSGQRSFLASPDRCGYVGTAIEGLPWGEAEPVEEESYTLIKSGPGNGACPGDGPPPFSPAVSSGAVNSNVNAFTPYFVRIQRQDTEQELTSYSLVLPKGVTGKLAGVAKCSDAAIAAARNRRGLAEIASPSCPAASQVGHTVVGYGVGSALTYAEGKVYLAGPFNGAPLSLVTINPATIGPFDLGNVVIQSAFQVDQHTAQLQLDSSASDPIPHILDGIVLHLKDIRVFIDRPEFTHNPSSCEASELTSRLTGSGLDFTSRADDSSASPSTYFQLLNCRILGFHPRLGVRLRGGTQRGDYPQLRTTFAARGPNDSNLKEIAVVIPRQEFLAQEHIRAICTRVQFAVEQCPTNSVYGSAVAYTQLLDEPLRGNVYLRSSSNALPDLVADLHSGTVRIVLEGKIGPGKRGGIRAFFTNLPDEPVSRFVMTLYGGKRGLLVNSADICEVPPVSNVKAIAQNNIGAVFTTKLRGNCAKQGKTGGDGEKGHKGGRQ